MKNSRAVPIYVVAIVALIGATWWFTRLPPLVDQLPGKKFAEVGSAFERRLLVRYPAGSSAAAFERDLHAQGFAVRHGADGNTAGYSSRFLACNRLWAVAWHVIPPDRIAGVKGSYRETCL